MSGMFTTKGRYALRVMVDIAQHDGWVSLSEVSQRQGISRKYLEQVVSLLVKAGYLKSQRGKGGGYRLTREPADYSVGDILRAAEGPLAPVKCLDCSSPNLCERAATCPTQPFWLELGKQTTAYLDSKTLADVIAGASAQGTPAEGASA
jgi:Rrf2 family iron-sulfur cluster assembly transcriptional regulator